MTLAEGGTMYQVLLVASSTTTNNKNEKGKRKKHLGEGRNNNQNRSSSIHPLAVLYRGTGINLLSEYDEHVHTRFVLTITGSHADDDDYNEGYYSACIIGINIIIITSMGRGGL